MRGKEIGRYVWEVVPHCKALSSLVYKRREGPLVKGLPILESLGVYRFCLGFTVVKCLSRVSIFFFLFFFFFFFFFFSGVRSKALERRNHGSQAQLRLPPPLQRYLLVVFSQARAASASGKPACFPRRLHPAACVASVSVSACVSMRVCVRVASGRPPGLSRLQAALYHSVYSHINNILEAWVSLSLSLSLSFSLSPFPSFSRALMFTART